MANPTSVLKATKTGRTGRKLAKQLPTVAEVRATMLKQVSPKVVDSLNQESDPPYSGRLDRRLARS